MTRLSSRITVAALALVAVAAVFGLCSPRPRAATRDRVARTVARAGFQRVSGQTGRSLWADEHQAEMPIPAVEAASDLAAPSVPDARGAAALPATAPVLADLVATALASAPPGALTPPVETAPVSGRAPPAL